MHSLVCPLCGTITVCAASTALTPREREIIELAATGLPDKQIAIALGISLTTVRTHLQRSYRRNGWSGRAEAVAALFSPAPSRGAQRVLGRETGSPERGSSAQGLTPRSSAPGKHHPEP